MSIFRKPPKVVTPVKPEQIELMAQAGSIVAKALAECKAAAQPGISTLELSELAEEIIRDHGAIPSFKGYEGFPHALCTSVNDVIVHGIPSKEEIIREGDNISIDCGAIYQSWHGDSAITFVVGKSTPEDDYLINVTRQALEAGIAHMKPGRRIGDISAAIAAVVTSSTPPEKCAAGYIVPGYGGHGIGQEMHLDPYVPNSGKSGSGDILVAGSVLAIEPMVQLGGQRTVIASDGWAVRTKNKKRAAHWEHTVAVTDSGPRVLTRE